VRVTQKSEVGQGQPLVPKYDVAEALQILAVTNEQFTAFDAVRQVRNEREKN